MTYRLSALRRGLNSIFVDRLKRRKKYLARKLAERSLRLLFEPLEERRLLAVSLTGGGTWVEQGPGVIFNGQVEGIANQPVAGAVQAVAVNEAQRILFAGTVNGGVWVTQAGTTNWTPKTNSMESLSIGAIAISPVNNNLVVAGTGSFSNGGGRGGRSVGFYVTEDGGNTWSHRGRSAFLDLPIRALAVTTQTVSTGTVDVFIAGTNTGSKKKPAGVYTSIDRGVTWTLRSGAGNLPIGAVSDIEIDPGVSGDENHPRTVYVAMPGKGVYRSTDFSSWTDVTKDKGFDFKGTVNVQLGIHRDGTKIIVYAGIVDKNNQFREVIRSTDKGVTWTQFASGFVQPSPNPGKQGLKNFSLAASKRNDDIIYIGGDRQAAPGSSNGCNDFSGNLFRGKDSVGFSSLVCSATGGTSPHADSRNLYFFQGSGGQNTDELIEVDDGGIYAIVNPEGSGSTTANPRVWTSLIGTTQSLRITEVNSVAYDSINNIFFSGHQDTGSAEQPTPGAIQWTASPIAATQWMAGDGQQQLFNIESGNATRYSLSNNYDSFYRRRYNTANQIVDLPALNGQDLLAQSIAPPLRAFGSTTAATAATNAMTIGLGTDDAMIIASGSFAVSPMVFNKLSNNPNNLVWGYFDLYESGDRGATLTTIESWASAIGSRDGLVKAVAYGGRGKNASERSSMRRT